MIDQNPQVGAKEHVLTGSEEEMQFMQGLIENGNPEMYWACPVCYSDENLIDL